MLFSLPCARRPSDDLVEKLIDCMGVSNLNAEMLLANFFNASILGDYARKLGKSDKGGTATLAERIPPLQQYSLSCSVPLYWSSCSAKAAIFGPVTRRPR